MVSTLVESPFSYLSMMKYTSYLYSIFYCFIILLLTACSKPNESIQIILPNQASNTHTITASDLKKDLEKIIDIPVSIVTRDKAKTNSIQFILGTTQNKKLIDEKLSELNLEIKDKNLAARSGYWHQLNDNTIVLAGGDIQGMQYAVYDYSKEVLGIDPLQYWTGHKASKITKEQLFQFENQIIPAPKVPLLIYFENDVDEISQFKKAFIRIRLGVLYRND